MKKLLSLLLIVIFFCSCSKNDVNDATPKPGDTTSNPIDTTYILSVSSLATGLDTPWEMASLPDGRVLVTERPGRIRVINNGILSAALWMDLTSIVTENGESGLMGISADPDFNTNKYVYIAYTYTNSSGQFSIRLVRLKEDATQKGIEDKILIDNVSAGAIHDGGAVKFGPDKKLYWSVGDANQPSEAQNKGALNGKILRLNADGSIPADNPFPNSYVYSYGHRNPQGLAWQPGSNLLYSTEHGPSGTPACCRDELNLIEAGKNYGWPIIYGTLTAPGMVNPIIYSGDNYTWAPGGITFITQGKWKGSAVFTGLRGESLYRVVFDPVDNRKILRLERHLENQYGRLRDVREAPNGDLWITTSNQDGRGTPVAGDDKILVVKIQ